MAHYLHFKILRQLYEFSMTQISVTRFLRKLANFKQIMHSLIPSKFIILILCIKLPQQML